MLSYVFGETKETSQSEAIFEQLTGQLVELGKRHLPTIEKDAQRLVDQAKDDLSKSIEENLKDVDLVELYNQIGSKIMNYLTVNAPNFNAEEIINHIKCGQEVLKGVENMGSLNNVHKVQVFRKRYKLMKKYGSLIIDEGKKEISILELGPTQSGKTALRNRLFNLEGKKFRLKGCVKSDTTDVVTMQKKINGILTKCSDSPGFFDSRGRDKRNLKKIIDFLRQNEVDIVLWVVKIQDIVNSSYKDLLIHLTDQFGHTIWKKTIVVLTHANDDPPDEYFDNDESLLEAWKNYTSAKSKMWKKAFKDIQKTRVEKPVNVPVILVENSHRHMKKIDGVGILVDGTPILETLMTRIFQLIKKDKTPYMFLAMAGDCKRLENETDDEDDSSIFMETDSDIQMSPIRTRAHPSPPGLTEQQTALNHAVDNLTQGPVSFWKRCVLF